MTTWTEKTQQSETWTVVTQETRVFSPLVFSHAYYNGKRVFALGASAGIWDARSEQSETWTPV
jgi:hypothetical protein